MRDSRDERIITDGEGNQWFADESGEPIKIDGKKVAPAKIVDPTASFPVFDTSGGRCALCGSLRCFGGCFK